MSLLIRIMETRKNEEMDIQLPSLIALKAGLTEDIVRTVLDIQKKFFINKKKPKRDKTYVRRQKDRPSLTPNMSLPDFTDPQYTEQYDCFKDFKLKRTDSNRKIHKPMIIFPRHSRIDLFDGTNRDFMDDLSRTDIKANLLGKLSDNNSKWKSMWEEGSESRSISDISKNDRMVSKRDKLVSILKGNEKQQNKSTTNLLGVPQNQVKRIKSKGSFRNNQNIVSRRVIKKRLEQSPMPLPKKSNSFINKTKGNPPVNTKLKKKASMPLPFKSSGINTEQKMVSSNSNSLLSFEDNDQKPKQPKIKSNRVNIPLKGSKSRRSFAGKANTLRLSVKNLKKQDDKEKEQKELQTPKFARKRRLTQENIDGEMLCVNLLEDVIDEQAEITSKNLIISSVKQILKIRKSGKSETAIRKREISQSLSILKSSKLQNNSMAKEKQDNKELSIIKTKSNRVSKQFDCSQFKNYFNLNKKSKLFMESESVIQEQSNINLLLLSQVNKESGLMKRTGAGFVKKKVDKKNKLKSLITPKKKKVILLSKRNLELIGISESEPYNKQPKNMLDTSNEQINDIELHTESTNNLILPDTD